MVYKISNKITIDSSIPISELQNRLVNSLQAEGVGKITLKDNGVEFQNYFPWGMASRTLLLGIMQGVSGGNIKFSSIDSNHITVSYKISLFPLFCGFLFTSFIFVGSLLIGIEILWSGIFILLSWVLYGVYKLIRYSQFNSFIRKACGESNSTIKQ